VYAAWLPAPDRPRGVFVVCAVVAAVGAALSAAYALRVARIVWVGDRPDRSADRTPDTVGIEAGVMAVLALAIVLLGVVPGPLLAMTSAAVAAIGTAP
jgi:NADH-quinone oxidoreductase subunit M